ncbi:ABC transporter permease [Nitrosomonas aestuarii]|nr:ABC transporter permease [Nitrosomonas aestuarii]
MHAGRVLVCDTPKTLQTARSAASLEEAFVGYIEEAVGQTKESTGVTFISQVRGQPISKDVVAEVPPPESTPVGLSRLLAYSYNESLQVLRDPIRLAFAFIGSVLLMLIFGFGITSDVEHLQYAALDLDQTPESRSYLRTLAGSPRYFVETPPLRSQAEILERLKANDISFAIEIPPHFGRDLKRGSTPDVSVWIDGAMPFRAETIQGYVEGMHLMYLEDLARQQSSTGPTTLAANIETRYRYNPTFESIYAMVPAVPTMLLIMIPAILVAVSMARDKELGSIINFYVTPTTRLEFLLGKQLPYIAIAMLNFGLLTFMAIVVFQVPLKGSALALTFGALLYVTATTGLGLLMSGFTSSQVAAVFATMIVAMMPTMQFSGMFQPVSTLDGGAKFIGSLWPATYYMHISVGAFTKGLAFRDLWSDFIALAAFIPAFTFLSALALKKQDR